MKRLLVLFAIFLVFSLFAPSVFALDPATMFQNDTPFWEEDTYPILSEGTDTYAPLSFFCGFHEIRLRKEEGAFCLYNQNTGCFFSYAPEEADTLMDETYTVRETRVPLYSGMPYLPLFSTAHALGLRVECLSSGVYTPVRLSDNDARLSLETLWESAQRDAS